MVCAKNAHTVKHGEMANKTQTTTIVGEDIDNAVKRLKKGK